MRRIASVLFLGTLFACVMAVVNLFGSLQIGGPDGMVIPSWPVLLAGPFALMAAASLHGWAVRRERRSWDRYEQKRAAKIAQGKEPLAAKAYYHAGRLTGKARQKLQRPAA